MSHHLKHVDRYCNDDMSKQDTKQMLSLAKKYRCVEALFVTGERPEQRYQEAKDWLEKNGYKERYFLWGHTLRVSSDSSKKIQQIIKSDKYHKKPK